MRILSIDPSSNKINTSTTGIVLLDNAKLIDCWVVGYGMLNFKNWFDEIGKKLEVDVVVIEKFEVRDNDNSKDNSVLETIAFIQLCYPNAILQRNAGYQSDIPNELLKLLGLWKFEKSHHQDVRAAARLGLFYAMRNDVEEVIQDIGRTAIEKMAN
ncbi:hypothetical protein PUW41_08175 [Streptococcus anginosus]|uniref:hypothetical protein n=1 Tax=Streptococcus TaxID=1301 RepID=UPI0008A877FE|nr:MULTISPECIES: hypothetical protein [Streptococcus]MBS6902378.1 hypothetical protein [Streptococcus anginosus]MCW0928680.1 hypothetical protein [Streptococcus anginosus]MCW0950914.1 hypothetical protein [Streptococcus anginosus]MCW0978919.1 hypothetical protein [Streptococcus anginosus]MCW0990384.1 hypothetical protein [Streptococcus anginosus]